MQEIAQQKNRVGNFSYIRAQSVITCGIWIISHCVIGAHNFLNGYEVDYSIIVRPPASKVENVSVDVNSGEIKLIFDGK